MAGPSGATARLALPYPIATDTADVPRDVQALATKLDGVSSITPPLVSALPGSPVDGQECYYQSGAMVTDGVIWHLRYRAASPNVEKWEYIGGGPLAHAVEAVESTSSATYVDLATVGPQVTTPLAGLYRIMGTTFAQPLAALAAAAIMGLKIGSATTNDADRIMQLTDPAAGGLSAIGGRSLFRTVGAGVVLKCQYRSATAVASTYGFRALELTPVRVG